MTGFEVATSGQRRLTPAPPPTRMAPWRQAPPVSDKAPPMPQLSVVVPVFNERDNIPPLLAEIAAALRGKVDFEIIYVDDDSSDDSRAVLHAQKASYPELRVLHHVTRSGQS